MATHITSTPVELPDPKTLEPYERQAKILEIRGKCFTEVTEAELCFALDLLRLEREERKGTIPKKGKQTAEKGLSDDDFTI